MTPADASRAARQLAVLLASANDLMADLLDRDALDRASTLIVLGARLAAELQEHADEVALQAVREGGAT